jgi:hypothetical protein
MYCNACSINVETLTESNKLKIHISTCRDIIKECNDTWNLAYSLHHIFNMYQIFSKVLRSHVEGVAKIEVAYTVEGPDTI